MEAMSDAHTDVTLKKLDSNAALLLSVPVGFQPMRPAFNGTNIWVPNSNVNSVTVVRASTGTVLATLTGNGLAECRTAAFDGERILVTNNFGHSVSLWNASDLTPLGSVALSTSSSSFPEGACSDGQRFRITLSGSDKLAVFEPLSCRISWNYSSSSTR